MSGPVARELDEILESMLSLKPPGVTQSKITSLTSLCNANIQSATVLIQRIYAHIKKAPPSHKLGVLYVVDSVTRGWVEQAKKNGQSLGPSEQPKDGTYAAGHKLVTQMLPSFVNETINRAPEDQKARINKLVDIWDRSSTFPQEMLSGFRQKLAAPATNAMKSTTPEGSPPKDFIPLNETPNAAPQEQNTSNILQALANMAKTNSGPPGQPPQGGAGNNPSMYGQSMPTPVNAATATQALNAFGNSSVGNPYGGMNGAVNLLQALPQAQSGTMNMQGSPAPQSQSNMPSPEQLQQQVQIIAMLQAQGIPQEQWAAVLSALMAAGAGGNPAQAPAPQSSYGQNQYGASGDSGLGPDSNFGVRSPPGRYRRSRSRSPRGYDRRRDESPRRRRDSPTYGRGDDRRSGNPYRQRSPDRVRRSESPQGKERNLPPPGPKLITWDNTLGRDNIKVLSRTLFVGGVTCSEETLRKIFSPYGIVQTCIVNVDKRHAFVKMVSRKDAISAKEGMERYKSQDMQLRTRWGVGFGPRDCSDYSSGVSIIPIYKLTDADRKWMLTAEYGGTGGEALEGCMVVEEPDIEIGAGVSSKAISRRMVTDKSGQHGPKSNRSPSHDDNYRQQPQRDDRRGTQQNNNANNGMPNMPNMPNFPFNFPMPAGFQLPPSFPFPGGSPAPGQPPPPGSN